MRIKLSTTLLCIMLLHGVTVATAQEDKPEEKDYTRGWYLGAQVGMPMAEADFSSFGADKFRPGWAAGIHAGYRFTPVWALEMTAGWGQQFLAEQQCCFERGYFLGTDHNRYRNGYHFPAGIQGWHYKDLKSRTFVHRYGLQVNMNILGFFNRTRESRWRLDISPAVYAVGTSSDLMTKADNTPVAENLNDWHLGYGGQAQVSYAVADNMNIGLYGGFTHLTGKPMDGMPELHSTNFIIDAGVKFSFAFGKVKSQKSNLKGESEKVRTEDDAPVLPSELVALPSDSSFIQNNTPVIPSDSPSVILSDSEGSRDSSLQSSTSVQNDIAEESDSAAVLSDSAALSSDPAVILSGSEGSRDSSLQSSTSVQNDIEEEVSTSHLSPFTFPVVYFSFNSIWIEPSERAKVKQIADMLKANPEMKIRVTGWGDEVGGEEANKRVSLQRAEAVKRVLGQWLIPADRIETVGAGIAYDAPSREAARNATTIEIME